MNLNGSSGNKIIFHRPLWKALDVVPQGYFYPEHLSPTLTFPILTLTLASSSLSFGAANTSDLTFIPRLCPERKALTVTTQKNVRKPILFSLGLTQPHPL